MNDMVLAKFVVDKALKDELISKELVVYYPLLVVYAFAAIRDMRRLLAMLEEEKQEREQKAQEVAEQMGKGEG